MNDRYFPTYDFVTDEFCVVDPAVVAEVIEEAESYLVVLSEPVKEKLGRWVTNIVLSFGPWPVY